MKNKFNRAAPLFVKMSLIMALLAVIQLLTFFAMMFISGEFSLTRRFAYSFLTEKTSNRASYVENYLKQRTSHVESYAAEVNRITETVLLNENKDSSAFTTDKSVNKRVISECAETVVALCRSSAVNDAFIYLNTGDLYDSDGVHKLVGFYVRDMDVYSEDTNNSDLLLEAGNSDIARGLGITMDFEWSLYSDITEANDFDFVTAPIDMAKIGVSGYWSGFSRISRSASPSMKYTLPLVLEDGTVYGVIGIGLLEKSIMSTIVTNDLFNDSACYLLALDADNDGVYDHQAHTGAAYAKLVSGDTKLDTKTVDEYGMLEFNTRVNSVGSFSELALYSANSPFNHQKWALISVAESNAILEIYNKLVKMFVISAAISLVIGVVLSVTVSRAFTKPMSDMKTRLEKVSDSGEIVTFVDTNISEFDSLAKSIVDLQKNVRAHASRVSDILSVSESGIGTFMFDRRTGNVFVGKSLTDILDFPDVKADEDFTIPFEKFREYLSYFDEHYRIFDNDIFTSSSGETKGMNIDTEYITDADNPKWFRFSFTKDEDVVMGLVQDITEVVRERRKIEHERDYDVTTDIYNRRAFYRRIEELFKQPEKLGTAAFLMMDLDNLKFVNDTFGHEYGDRYIRAAADALKTLLPKNGVVARLSGDEFIAFIYGGGSKDEIREIITEFKHIIDNSSCKLADGSSYKVRSSGGIAWYPDNSTSYEQLVKYADFSMYTIKHSTKGVFAEFNESSYLNDSILITGIQELNRIIDSNDIKFAYQPIIRVKDGAIFGYEAQMCPQSETITSISELLRIAKSGAKLYEIERLTFFLGLASFSRLIEDGIVDADKHLFLKSISECMLDDRAFNGIEENYRPILKNVVLENLDIDQHDNALIAKKQDIVSRWGGMTALDNFGNGHNNERTLFSINPDMIIIDKNLIGHCDTDQGKYTVIRNLVHLTRERGVLVVAQGIEREEELHTVICLGVDLIQGYFISKPEYMPPQPISPSVLETIAEYVAEKQEQ